MTIPFQLLQIDHLVLRVADIDRMLKFYLEVVGCRLEKIQEHVGLWQVRAGTSLIDLVSLDGKLGKMGGVGPGHEGRNLDHFCLRIQPFDPVAIKEHLRAHGVEPGEVESRYGAEGEGPSLYFSDPEGNTIEFKGPPWSPLE